MTTSEADARASDVLRLVAASPPRGYQRVILPDGRIIPGADRSRVADRIFPARLDRRTILDIGCDYGYFLHEAVRRGAVRAVGIEHDTARHAIADRIAQLWNGAIEIRQGQFPHMPFHERFDYVLCLNVLHHSSDPWSIMTSAAALCRGTLVVEFALPSGVQYWCDVAGVPETELSQGSSVRKSWLRLRYGLYTRTISRLGRNRPLIGVGSARHGRTFYFNEAAFRSTFMVQYPICKRIDFAPSPGRERQRMLAFCEVNAAENDGSAEPSR